MSESAHTALKEFEGYITERRGETFVKVNIAGIIILVLTLEAFRRLIFLAIKNLYLIY